MTVQGSLHDLRGQDPAHAPALDADSYRESQLLATQLRGSQSDGIVYPSVRSGGECVGLFYPDLASGPIQGRHLDYHWDGNRVDLYRDPGSRRGRLHCLMRCSAGGPKCDREFDEFPQ